MPCYLHVDITFLVPLKLSMFFSFLFQKYKKCQDKEMFCKVLNMKVTSCCSDSCNSISFISLSHSSQNKSFQFFFSLKICIVSFFSFHLFLFRYSLCVSFCLIQLHFSQFYRAYKEQEVGYIIEVSPFHCRHLKLQLSLITVFM